MVIDISNLQFIYYLTMSGLVDNDYYYFILFHYTRTYYIIDGMEVIMLGYLKIAVGE